MTTKKGINGLWFLEEYKIELKSVVFDAINKYEDKELKERGDY